MYTGNTVVRCPSLKIWEELNDPDILSQLSKDGITIIGEREGERGDCKMLVLFIL